MNLKRRLVVLPHPLLHLGLGPLLVSRSLVHRELVLGKTDTSMESRFSTASQCTAHSCTIHTRLEYDLDR
jgi:hypothetical protein